MYYDTYRATGKRIDELNELARSRGFANPGPIVAFPINARVFNRLATPGALAPGALIAVPWRPDLLRKLIATMDHLAAETARSTTALIAQERASKENLEQFLLLIDCVSMLASIGKGIGQLVIEGAKSATMTSAEATAWLINSRLDIANNIATLAIPAPSEPKKDFKFFVRHTLGPWTPSFWASAWAAYKTGDVDIYLYGPAAIEYQTKLKIKAQADRDIQQLKAKSDEAKRQLAAPFYAARI